MACDYAIPFYIPHSSGGILNAVSNKNGRDIAIKWAKAYPSSSQYQLAYNIYFSSVKEDIYTEGVKYVSVTSNILSVEIGEFPPGDTYYFAVRATQFLPAWVDFNSLPSLDDAKYYPESVLLQEITDTDTQIFVADIDQYPNYGIIQVGTELIRYLNKDIANNALINITRGFFNTSVQNHDIGLVKHWKGQEEPNEVIYQETAVFSYPEYPHTYADGYKEVTKDWLTTDLSASDASQAGFPRYDFTGWRRTDPGALLRGECVGTYFGGELYCADGYEGVGRMVRGIPINEESHRRLEVLLDTIGTGELCVLLRKQRTGKRCFCYQLHNEHPDDRCPSCRGSGFVEGWEQFFNTRRSDGLIRVRFSPAEDKLKLEEYGMDPSYTTDAWTLVYPIIKDRDILVRLGEDGKEEFRYEVLSVNRNKLIDGLSGAQKLQLQRVRKTNPIYTVRVNYDTSPIPSTLQTSLGFVGGPGGIPPHIHIIHVGPKDLVAGLEGLNQMTEMAQGHNHMIRNGIIQPYYIGNSGTNLVHSHEIIIP